MPVHLRAFIIGLIGGSLGGFVGLGGGVVMVPLLTLWVGFSQHEAHGTSLAVLIATGTVGAWLYGTHGHVSWSAAGWLAAASVVASSAAAQYAARIPEGRLRKIFGAFLLVAAAMLLVKDRLLLAGGGPGEPVVGALLIIGGVGGATAGLLGVGGAALIVPLLVLTAGFSQHIAQGTSLAALIVTGLAGAVVYARHGFLRTDLMMTLLPGVVLGSVVGSYGAIGTPGPALRMVFAVVLLWLGGRYLGLGALVQRR